MDPLSIYSERSFSRACHYELYPDRLRIKGKVFLQNEFDVTIGLKDLNPDYQKLKAREKSFWAGLWVALVPAILLEILVSVFHITFVNPVFGLMICLVVTGLLLCAVTVKKVEYYRFTNSSGIHVLDIARVGKDKQKFDGFIICIVDSTRKAKAI